MNRERRISNPTPEIPDIKGLTKREYLAVIAMQSILISSAGTPVDEVAEWSVNYADALIEALNN